jgi:hypothetical protein
LIIWPKKPGNPSPLHPKNHNHSTFKSKSAIIIERKGGEGEGREDDVDIDSECKIRGSEIWVGWDDWWGRDIISFCFPFFFRGIAILVFIRRRRRKDMKEEEGKRWMTGEESFI